MSGYFLLLSSYLIFTCNFLLYGMEQQQKASSLSCSLNLNAATNISSIVRPTTPTLELLRGPRTVQAGLSNSQPLAKGELQRIHVTSGPVNFGITAFHTAVIKSNLVEIRNLIATEADINARDCFGETPLHKAATTGNIAVIELLLLHGAHITLKDKKGQTPLEKTIRTGKLGAMDLLMKYEDMRFHKITQALAQLGPTTIARLLDASKVEAGLIARYRTQATVLNLSNEKNITPEFIQKVGKLYPHVEILIVPSEFHSNLASTPLLWETITSAFSRLKTIRWSDSQQKEG